MPRTGGVILSDVPSKDELIRIIDEDPFKKHYLADYDIIEFIPSKEMMFLGNG